MQRGEIESLAAFDAHREHSRSLRGMVIQSVDLTERTTSLKAARVRGAVFLGCDLAPEAAISIQSRGGLIFPTLPAAPCNPYRSTLYTATELYAPLPTGSYADSLDARIYAWTRTLTPTAGVEATLTRSLHDHAISDALDDAVTETDPRQMVGIMGGHALQRGEAGYRDAVELGAGLAASGRLVLTGGGPGAMEAANLGAYLSRHTAADREEACRILAAAPTFKTGIDAWARAAFQVLERFPGGQASLGIPTWFYGHEPPNAFATGIAKYFSNAIREDILLSLCRGGLIYLPGAAGTVQELFQAVTEVYYTDDATRMAPLVLVGTEQWTDALPAWPLLRSLARGRAMERSIALVDSMADAVAALG